MAAQNTPAAEFEVTADLVRGLLECQHPALAELPLSPLANGWDNVLFRLGDEFTVRLPRRQMAADLVEHEQRWLGALAPRLPLPIPAPTRVGVPSGDYPWKWSVCPWLDGEPAADTRLADPLVDARRLGEFLQALHQPAPPEAPINPYRGGPVGDLGQRVASNLEKLGKLIDGTAVAAHWADLSGASEWDQEAVWVHGDLHTANVLVANGALSAVIDFGDLTACDPAVDFAIAWMMFEPPERDVLRSAAGNVDDATWRRAEAWALHFALLYLLYSADNERFQRMGTQLLNALLPTP